MGLGGWVAGKSCCDSVTECRLHCQVGQPAKYVRQLANLYQIRGRPSPVKYFSKLGKLFYQAWQVEWDLSFWRCPCTLKLISQKCFWFRTLIFLPGRWCKRLRWGNICFKLEYRLSVLLLFLGFLDVFEFLGFLGRGSRRWGDYLCGALSESPRNTQHLRPFT